MAQAVLIALPPFGPLCATAGSFAGDLGEQDARNHIYLGTRAYQAKDARDNRVA